MIVSNSFSGANHCLCGIGKALARELLGTGRVIPFAFVVGPGVQGLVAELAFL
jgi:hypothetical protein